MNRNTELHFSKVPQIDIKRSKFDLSHSVKTTANAGDIVPIYIDEILPGDTVQMDMAELIRMATPIYPIMDNLFADIYFFFVPNRLLWNHWKEFWGENENPWIQQTEYEVPQITAPAGGWEEGTIADYMGIPTKVQGISVSALPFRAYAQIFNDWFRDENLKQNCHIYKDEATRAGSNTGDYVLNTELGGKPCKAAKFHGYFTSALPSMQKGPAVTVPLGSSAPVLAKNNLTASAERNLQIRTYGNVEIAQASPIKWGNIGTPLASSNDGNSLTLITPTPGGDSTLYATTAIPQGTKIDGGLYPKNLMAETANGDYSIHKNAISNNLYADLADAAATTISALRTAFAIQKYYENAARAGTRYIEYIRSVFGVTSSDARFQRAEYLGGHRLPINIDQIIQTSSTDATSPQGNTAGFSCTLNHDSMFTKSFEEHGILMGLMTIRTNRTYQQGLRKMWSRKRWEQFYNPYFANLSEDAILNKELYATGTEQDEEAFGYQERWSDYRYRESYVTGYMRSNATGSLDVWHFADNYNALPILGTTWIDEPTENVDRTIAVTSQLTHQFIIDIFYKTYYTRPMPVYSVPGLIDHV